ncbi:MAG: ubiA [Spirosoma sp.]|nr:ubiA [Spirosoma sp.]
MQTQNWLLLAFLSMCFAGLTSVIAKFGLRDISADLGLAVRTTVVFGLVWLNFVAWHSVQELQQLNWKTAGFLILSGVTTSCSWILYYKAIKIGNVSDVALIDKGSIIITLLLSFSLLREPITAKVLVGAFFIVSGLLILAWR